MAHQASRLIMPLLLSPHATELCMRFWWVNFVSLGVMYANLVLAELLDPQLHNGNPAIQESVPGSW